MRKVWYWVIGIVLAFAFSEIFVQDEDPKIAYTPIPEEIVDVETKDDFLEIKEPHWRHMPLTYKINNCPERQKNLTRLAFEKIEFETGYIVDFEETSEEPDIEINCKLQGVGGESAIADALPYTDTYFPNLIYYADINFYGQGGICLTGYPALEVHEILHTFGFVHNGLTSSIMHPYSAESSRKCETTKMDDQYTNCLKYIYSNGEFGECSIKNYNGDSPWSI